MQANDQAAFIFIGNVTRSTNTTIPTLPNGAVGIFDEFGTAIGSAALSSTPTKGVQVVQRKADGGLLFSPVFTYNEIFAKDYTAAAADTQQVSYLGTTSTTVTGMGTITAGNNYSADIELLNGLNNAYTNPNVKGITYQATTADTQASVAKGLFDSAQRSLKWNFPEGNKPIKVERIADIASGAAYTGTSTLVKVTKGSQTAEVYIKVADGTSDFSASTASVAASTATTAIAFPSTSASTFTFDAVALGTGAGHTLVTIGETKYLVADAGTDAQNATAVVAAINAGTQATAVAATAGVTITYKSATIGNLPPMVLISNDDSTWTLVAVTTSVGEAKQVTYRTAVATTTAATFTLDTPWQGETGYVYEGTTAVTSGIATLTTGLWGLKFTGLSLPVDRITGKYELVRFAIKPKTGNDQIINPITGTAYAWALGFDSSVTSYAAQGAKEGTGTYNQIATEEVFLTLQNKEPILRAFPPTKYTTEANASYVYDMTDLRIGETLPGGFATNSESLITITVACNSLLTTNDNDILKTNFTVS